MDPAGVPEHLRANHAETLSAVESRLTAVARELDTPADRATLQPVIAAALSDADLLRPLVAVLEDAVAAAGSSPQADPVAAPPYVVVTARGPMLRANDGDQRLVVLLRGFERAEGGYVPAAFTVEATVR